MLEDKPNETEYRLTIKQASAQEGNKLLYDTYKHLTTLNTGSIVLVATLSEKVFKDANWKPLVGITLVFFVASMVAAFFSMGVLASKVHDAGDPENIEPVWEYFLRFTAVPALLFFLLGVTSFVVFSLRNFIL